MSDAAKRILVVEDQRLIAADIESTLKKIGYQVAASVATGEDAIAQASAVRPDLILMDIRLRDEMDGIQAAQVIRGRMDVPLIYLTANADEETIVRAMETMPLGYLVKPFNERELRAAIEVALHRHETDRLLADERARRHAAEEFKWLVDGVKDHAIFRIDAHGRVATWNSGAERLKGYGADEIIGRHFSVFYTPEAIAAGHPQEVLELALERGSYAEQGWRLRKDGTRFWADVSISALRDAAGAPRGFAKITRDLSERRRVEEAQQQNAETLRRAVQLRDEFLSVASHELRTPLTALGLQLEGLQRLLGADAAPDRTRVARKLDMAIRQSDRLGTLVEGLLDVSRLDAGGLQLHRERFDLRELVEDVAGRLAEVAARARSELRLQLGEAVTGTWDRSRLDQVLMNLIGNALKYGAGEPVEVSVGAAADQAEVRIRDHGIGISPADVDRIFGRFERAVPTEHYGGLGLGLYISSRIVQAHGGAIAVERPPGPGAAFVVRLPREADRERTSQP
jgi:PAS domain S-box-containing protein